MLDCKFIIRGGPAPATFTQNCNPRLPAGRHVTIPLRLLPYDEHKQTHTILPILQLAVKSRVHAAAHWARAP